MERLFYNQEVVDIETAKRNLENRIVEIVEEEYRWNLNDSKDAIEIYCNYNDEMSDGTIKEIVNANNPRETFDNILCEWASDYAIEYGERELEETIRNNLTDAERKLFEIYEDEFNEFIQYRYSFYYSADHFNKDLRAFVMVDSDNANYEFTCDNICNYYSNRDGVIDDNSSLLWLAKQQGKEEELIDVVKKYYDEDNEKSVEELTQDKFIISCIQEWVNLSSSMGTLIFLVKMDLFTYFDLIEGIKAKSISGITFDKKTECGLFDTWNGSGSVLEIELDKDVFLPLENIDDICVDGARQRGYDVDEVYGLVGSCWKETMKIV